MTADEEIAKRAFESFYLKDVKASDGPIPWGHSWIESRWKFWWAAWQASRSALDVTTTQSTQGE